MKTIHFYKLSILFLVALNLTFISYLFFTLPPKSPHRRGHDFQNEAIKILQLNEKQVEKFEDLAFKHSQDMEKVQTNQLERTKEYFEIKDTTSKSDSLLNLIKEGEAQKIKITKNHFNDIKNILTTEQLPNYYKFEREALNKILLQKRPKPER